MSMKLTKSIFFLSLTTLTSISTQTYASDFSLPFVNTSGLGNIYSGWAVSADDASTAFTNPAGLTKIQHMQLVGSAIGLTGHSTYSGTANTIPSLTPPLSGNASSSIGALIPTLYFAAPLGHDVVFAFSQNIPFALGTNYAKNSIVRYAATRSQIIVMDFGPSLGFKLTKQLSAGIGLDFEHISFTLNQMQGFPLSTPDAEGQNNLRGWGYGLHAGLLYDITAATHVGINYSSQVMFHTTGSSTSFGPTATFRTTSQKANAALPTVVELSADHAFNRKWTVLGTVFYTGWSTFNQLTLKNTMLPSGTTTSVTIPFQYHNTLDYAVGVNYSPNDKWVLRTGVQFMNTPSNNRDRSVPDPVGDATIIAIGARYLQNQQLSYDIGYAHSFFSQTAMNAASPIQYLNGHSNQMTNLFGAQINWNIT